MVEKLLALFKALQYEKQSMTLDLTYDKVADWWVHIEHRDSGTVIFSENGGLDYTCARGYIALSDWAREYEDLEDIEPNLGL